MTRTHIIIYLLLCFPLRSFAVTSYLREWNSSDSAEARALASVALSAGAEAPAQGPAPGTFRTPVIDGDLSDWAGVPSVDGGWYDPGNSDRGHAYIKSAYVANDAAFLYIRLEYYYASDGSGIATYLDNDSDENTRACCILGTEVVWGYSIGADVRDLNLGYRNLINGAISGSGTSDGWVIGREYSIPLSATFASDGSPVFPNDSFTLMIVDPLRATADPFVYTLAIPEPSPLLAVAGFSLFYLLRRRPARCG